MYIQKKLNMLNTKQKNEIKQIKALKMELMIE